MTSSYVKRELTGWRDQALSQRHRDWGFNCPGFDIDFLLIEYDLGKAMAVIDYKRDGVTWPPDPSHPTLRALVDLADRRPPIPAFVVRYDKALRWFEPFPLNDLARVWTPVPKRITELDWVRLLYRMRARAIPSDVAELLAA